MVPTPRIPSTLSTGSPWDSSRVGGYSQDNLIGRRSPRRPTSSIEDDEEQLNGIFVYSPPPGQSQGHSPESNCSLNSSQTNSNDSRLTKLLRKEKEMRGSPNNGGSRSRPGEILPIPPPKGHGQGQPIQGDSSEGSSDFQEFLPICDALFNLISLAAYFCDIVFDVLVAYNFYQLEEYQWSITCLVFITTSIVLSQGLSLRWYAVNQREGQRPPCGRTPLLLSHLALSGVLWRYFKLFIPVNLRFIKSEVRDLCLLRLVHGFSEAAPILLIQLYLMTQVGCWEDVSDLSKVCSALSLFSLCWALASFSKNIRAQNVHKLVLTWPGIICQFLWRTGTVSSRLLALTLYGAAFGSWVFLVIGLHWFSMLMWLLSPGLVFHGEKLSRVRKVSYSALIAVVYTFCYINVSEVGGARRKAMIYYGTMAAENGLLVALWWIGVGGSRPWYTTLVLAGIPGGFIVGLTFMVLYYQVFHIRKLSYGLEGSPGNLTPRGRSKTSMDPGNNNSLPSPHSTLETQNEKLRKVLGGTRNNNLSGESSSSLVKRIEKKKCLGRSGGLGGFGIGSPAPPPPNPNVPGVFNCRFNPAIKRKKKKPTTFVPPPLDPSLTTMTPTTSSAPCQDGYLPGRMSHPFWKPTTISENDHNQHSTSTPTSTALASRIDIQQKIVAKKQQQLADLREIEEEIKAGKLTNNKGPSPTQQDLEQVKSHGQGQPWFRAQLHHHHHHHPLNPRGPLPPIPNPSFSTSELLLDPTYLMYMPPPDGQSDEDKTHEVYDTPLTLDPCLVWKGQEQIIYQNQDNPESMTNPEFRSSRGRHLMNDRPSDSRLIMGYLGRRRKQQFKNSRHSPVPLSMSHYQQPQSSATRDGINKSYRLYSDLESLRSLPRSYTLPREFKFKRKLLRRTARGEGHGRHPVPSTNSSDDGDVDSGEDEFEVIPAINGHPGTHMMNYSKDGSGSGPGRPFPMPRRTVPLPETKL